MRHARAVKHDCRLQNGERQGANGPLLRSPVHGCNSNRCLSGIDMPGIREGVSDRLWAYA